MTEKFVIQDGKKLLVVDAKSFKKKETITMPQAFYKNSIFAPTSQDLYESNFHTQKSIKLDNIKKCKIYNPILNQTHANIIDAIFYNALQYKIRTFDNTIIGINVIIALDEVLKTLHANNDYSWFNKNVMRILQAIFYMNFYVYDENHNKILHRLIASIIDSVLTANDIVQNKYIKSIGRYDVYNIITLGPLFVNLMRNTWAISLPRSFIPKILDLKYPINQAIARYCIASGEVNEQLENLLIKLGVDAGKISSDNYFTMIKEEQDKLFEYFGIEINQNNSELILQANKNNAVRIYEPKSPFLTLPQ